MIWSGDQFWFPATTWPLAKTMGDADSTVGHSSDHGVGVGRSQRNDALGPLRHASAPTASRKHDDQIGAHVLKLVLNHPPGRLADRNQQDHRGHADDDAEHGQSGSHLVLRQGPKGDS